MSFRSNDVYINDNKSTTSKKYGAAIGVAGVTLAAALLLAGRSNAPAQLPAGPVVMLDDMIDHNIT